jgi:hypothetical protein
MVHFVDHLINIHSIVTLEGFEVVILIVKNHYTISYDLLIIELKHRFLDHEPMNVFMVIYPQ